MEKVRLINANDVKELLHDILGLQPLPFEDEVDRMVDRIPTAYDVDKVVEEMKFNAKKMSETTLPHTYYKAIGTSKCEEIIRNGGK